MVAFASASEAPNMPYLQATLDHVDAIADWLLDSAESAEERGDLNATLELVRSAAVVLSRQNRSLVSPRAEGLIRRVATSIAMARASDLPCLASETMRGSLHVLSEALPAGGLSAMAQRWICLEPSGAPQHVVLLQQQTPVPEEFARTVARSNGRLFLAPPGQSTIEAARWLRTLAHDIATQVVLHVDVSDVISATAFGADGGPPVMLVNHSAHIFWIGVSFADLVLNCRGSALETHWTRRYRGAERCATLPIPLALAESASEASEADRRRVQDELGIAPDAVVILTIGASFKFLPLGPLDFVATCVDILESVPSAVLLAVGVTNDERWAAASRSVSGRMRALGVLGREQVERIQSISDIYVEGFPFGTTTALLEACARGIPAVVAPAECPPPYATDGIALDGLVERAESAHAFKQMVIALCREPALRKMIADALKRSVREHHCGPGWAQHLDRAYRALPAEHQVRPAGAAEVTPTRVHEYWTRFVIERGGGYQWLMEAAVANNLRDGRLLLITERMVRGVGHSGAIATGAMPVRLLVLAVNEVLPWLPARMRLPVFRAVCFFGRGSPLTRLLSKLSRMWSAGRTESSWYEEYRQVKR